MARRRPLEGRTILLTRPEAESRSLAGRLASLGARVAIEPVLAFESLAGSASARTAAERAGLYDVLVFTSPNGVRFFAEALRLAGRGPGDVHGQVAAVGPGTARALEDAGLPVHLVAEDSRAEGLAEALDADVRPGKRVLWARPESAREVLGEALRAAGAEVDEVRLYRTVGSPGAAAAASGLAKREYDAVVFASPSALRLLLDAAGEARAAAEAGLACAKRVAIGEVTANALERAGFPAAAVADTPTDDGLEDAILRALRD